MHYFKRNIGDYHKKAGRLSMLEHGAYTLLIDSCYDRERFPSLDDAIEWTWARTDEEIAAVKFVLSKFFILVDGIYTQNRISEEIAQYHSNSGTNKRIALEREERRRVIRTRSVNEPCTVEHEPPPNQEPLTTNQEPLTNTNSNTTSPPAEKPLKADPIQYEEILKLYHQILPMCPKVVMLTTKRKGQIAARWKSGVLPDLETWKSYFEFVSKSDWLTGKIDPSPGRKRFVADLEWITSETNFTKIWEKKYHGKN
jgi:uncharacterized protein YdaU (DUF1376 family)